MNPEEIVRNVVQQTVIELKKLNNIELNGFYIMLDSKFTGLIKLNDDEIILIQSPNKVVHHKSQNDFNTAHPLPKIEFFLPEPYKEHFRTLSGA